MLRKPVIIHVMGLFILTVITLIIALIVAQILPSGTQIVYMANLNAQYDLFLTDLRLNQTIQLTHTRSQNSRYPAWSADGRYLGYHGNIDQRHGIFIMDTQTMAVDWVDFGRDDLGEVYDEAMVNWSRDGQRVVFHRGNNTAGYAIYMADVTDESLTRLTEGSGQDLHPYWSPDGTQIAYSRHDENNVGTIHILNVEDALNGVDNVGEPITTGIFPAWSPDGSMLVFSDTVRTGSEHLYLYDFATGETPAVTGGEIFYMNTTPDWSSDGGRIIFSSNRDGSYALYTIKPDGTDEQRLSIPIIHFNLQAPAYRP